jgi:hypothetical protein
MLTKELVIRVASQQGFLYSASPSAGEFVELLQTKYSLALIDRAEWLQEHVLSLQPAQFDELVRARLGWSMEFQGN